MPKSRITGRISKNKVSKPLGIEIHKFVFLQRDQIAEFGKIFGEQR
jgi:hypothetical protein